MNKVPFSCKVRTVIFYIAWSFCIFFWSVAIVLSLPLRFEIRHYFATHWSDSTMWLLRVICGLKWQVRGEENVPQTAVVVVANHQSAWETVFLPLILRKQVWVLKRELLRIPFFGWAIASVKPIAINRQKGKRALAQVLVQGKQRLNAGYSIVIFPEGHRFPYDAPIKFKQGAAKIAERLAAPILPIAHNAGMFWPRSGWIMPGTITVEVGKPVEPNKRKADAINAEIEDIVRQMRDKIQAEELAKRKLI
ncbi:MAG: 1-acyl-sn-glycerol-3-phosphate acyltransferase [Cardiobacteriaceae bacterium]|nr:1-acyl-sn-glycerol-3-phosphate acyltransferase [Cardiobacteriaceae bacterium]